jgi:sulfite exporter TauE/SafE
MIELPLIWIAGLLGSSHCLGMCGGFALTIGNGATSWRNNTVRQLLYTSGRLFTYAVLGAVAGYAGSRLTGHVPALVSLPAILSLAAGLLLIYQGLLSAGWLPKSGVVGRSSCLAGSFFAPLLVGPGWLQVFLAGLFTGLLPCGLLYGMVALAASTHAMLPAMAVMLAFGLGTAPLMILAGLGGSLMRLSWRKPLFRLAACCLILTGGISVARGASFLLAPKPAEACPFCAK